MSRMHKLEEAKARAQHLATREGEPYAVLVLGSEPLVRPLRRAVTCKLAHPEARFVAEYKPEEV